MNRFLLLFVNDSASAGMFCFWIRSPAGAERHRVSPLHDFILERKRSGHGILLFFLIAGIAGFPVFHMAVMLFASADGIPVLRTIHVFKSVVMQIRILTAAENPFFVFWKRRDRSLFSVLPCRKEMLPSAASFFVTLFNYNAVFVL